MRTQQEIVNRIDALKDNDFMGFQRSDLLSCLDFEHAKPFLKEGVTADQWQAESCEPEAVKARMLEYMPFAWEKANGCRGISASRSMSHYSAWIWLLGDEDYFGDLQFYQHYGKSNLIMICKRYGWEHQKWDDSVRVNSEMELP